MDFFVHVGTYVYKIGASLEKKGVNLLPRHYRQKSITNIYHVMIRGINKQNIFIDILDKQKFLKTLKTTKDKYSYHIYAYCLMDNHVHLLIETNQAEISSIMKSITITYALYFNKKYERVGHLFQNRYNSKCVENDRYLLNVMRYIHRNPENANLCLIEDYKWSSFQEYVNEEKALIDSKYILRKFSENIIISKEKFKEFHFDEYQNHYEDILEYEFIGKFSDKEASEIIKEELHIQDLEEIAKYNVTIRNDFIQKIKKINGISKSQISRILHIDRKIIERA